MRLTPEEQRVIELKGLDRADDVRRLEYELARKIGDARYGSPCPHGKIRNGVCATCLRKVK